MSRNTMVGISVIVLSVGLFVGAVISTRSTGDFEKTGKIAPGRVVQLITRTTYHPQVEFVAADGQTYRFESPHGSRPADYAIGEVVEVIYNPSSPGDTARIHTVMGMWFLPLLLGGMGLLFFGLGLFLILSPVLSKRRDNRLLNHGKRVKASVTEVGESPHRDSTGGVLYRVSAEWVDPETEIKHFFNSRDLKQEPTVSVGENISVHIDPFDENKYFVYVP